MLVRETMYIYNPLITPILLLRLYICLRNEVSFAFQFFSFLLHIYVLYSNISDQCSFCFEKKMLLKIGNLPISPSLVILPIPFKERGGSQLNKSTFTNMVGVFTFTVRIKKGEDYTLFLCEQLFGSPSKEGRYIEEHSSYCLLDLNICYWSGDVFPHFSNHFIISSQLFFTHSKWVNLDLNLVS